MWPENYFNPSFSLSSNLGVFDDGAEKFPGVKLMKSFRLSLSPCKLTFESEHLEGGRERAAPPENDCTTERDGGCQSAVPRGTWLELL